MEDGEYRAVGTAQAGSWGAMAPALSSARAMMLGGDFSVFIEKRERLGLTERSRVDPGFFGLRRQEAPAQMEGGATGAVARPLSAREDSKTRE